MPYSSSHLRISRFHSEPRQTAATPLAAYQSRTFAPVVDARRVSNASAPLDANPLAHSFGRLGFHRQPAGAEKALHGAKTDPSLTPGPPMEGEAIQQVRAGQLFPASAGTGASLTASSSNAIQRRTSIAHTTDYISHSLADGTVEHYKVGKAVEARLDPRDHIKGSQTGATWDWMVPMRAEFGNIIKGHLLNHDLGGFAKEENLYPITSSANQAHSAQVEQEVKRLLFDEAPGRQERLLYKVDVVEQQDHDPTDATFHCEWGWEGGAQLGATDIRSAMVRGSNYGGYAGQPANKYAMTSDNPWYHGSRRELDEDVESDWAEATGFGGRISVTPHAQGFGAITGRDAVKLKFNVIPAILTGNMLVLERLVGEIASDAKYGVFPVWSLWVSEAVDRAVKTGLQTGPGRYAEVNNLLLHYLRPNWTVMHDRLWACWQQVKPVVRDIANNADAEIGRRQLDPQGQECQEVVWAALTSIQDEVVSAIDAIDWKAPN